MKETNMEHYRAEILEVMECSNAGFGKVDGKIKSCRDMDCVNCDFVKMDNYNTCNKERVLWMMEEYKPEITLTAKEKHFVESLETGWIARDKDGEISVHEDEPYKVGNEWLSKNDMWLSVKMLYGLFPFITWEDEEPWSVEELRKL